MGRATQSQRQGRETLKNKLMNSGGFRGEDAKNLQITVNFESNVENLTLILA